MDAVGEFQIQELFGRDILALDLLIIYNTIETVSKGDGGAACKGNSVESIVAPTESTTACEEEIPLEVLNYNEEDYESDVVYDDDDYGYDDNGDDYGYDDDEDS